MLFRSPYVKSGKMKALGITTVRRTPLLPELPTMMEAGLPNFEFGNWHGLFAPAKTPATVLEKLEAEVRKAFAAPDMRERFVKLGLQPIGNGSKEFKPFVANAVKRFAEAAKVAGIVPE